MEKTIIVQNIDEVNILREKLLNNTTISVDRVKKLVDKVSTIQFLRELKFEKIGFDPLFEKDFNFIEFLNQTFTYLISLYATKWLLQTYKGKTFSINMGTQKGYDIESVDQTVICECFSTTSVKSNKKLENDILRVYNDPIAIHKYVIFYSAENDDSYINRMREKYKLVTISRVDFSRLIN